MVTGVRSSAHRYVCGGGGGGGREGEEGEIPTLVEQDCPVPCPLVVVAVTSRLLALLCRGWVAGWLVEELHEALSLGEQQNHPPL